LLDNLALRHLKLIGPLDQHICRLVTILAESVPDVGIWEINLHLSSLAGKKNVINILECFEAADLMKESKRTAGKS